MAWNDCLHFDKSGFNKWILHWILILIPKYFISVQICQKYAPFEKKLELLYIKQELWILIHFILQETYKQTHYLLVLIAYVTKEDEISVHNIVSSLSYHFSKALD